MTACYLFSSFTLCLFSFSPSVGGRWSLPLQSLWISLEEAIHSCRVSQQDWTTWAGQSPHLTLVSYMTLSFFFTLHCPDKKNKTWDHVVDSCIYLSGRSNLSLRNRSLSLTLSIRKRSLVPRERNSWFEGDSIIGFLDLASFIYFEQNYWPSLDTYNRVQLTEEIITDRVI